MILFEGYSMLILQIVQGRVSDLKEISSHSFCKSVYTGYAYVFLIHKKKNNKKMTVL